MDNTESNLHQKCAKCLNHGTVVPLKGHKKVCPWNFCDCLLCRSTETKRKLTAARAAQRRAQLAEKQRTTDGDSQKARQFCRLCKNHGRRIKLKGHKRMCPYRTRLHLVICEDCNRDVDRRKIIADRVAQRRAEALDKNLQFANFCNESNAETVADSLNYPLNDTENVSVQTDLQDSQNSAFVQQFQYLTGGLLTQITAGSRFLLQNVLFLQNLVESTNREAALQTESLLKATETLKKEVENILENLDKVQKMLRFSGNANEQ